MSLLEGPDASQLFTRCVGDDGRRIAPQFKARLAGWRIWILGPASSDLGSAIGVALACMTSKSDKPPNVGRAEAIQAFLGSSATDFPFRLTPIAALREIVAVCESIATGHPPPQQQDRKSLRNDVQMALWAIGPKLKHAVQPTLQDFKKGELAKLPELLGESAGSVRLGAAAKGLIAEFRQARVLRPAWEDLIDDHDGGSAIDEVRQLALILREIDESLGHEWKWRKAGYRRLLADDHDPGDWQVIEAPPSARSAEVAWFVFADADLPDGALRVGQIQFFSSRLWPAAVTNESFFDSHTEFDFPVELDKEAVKMWFDVNDHSEALVYARVEFAGPRAEPDRTPAVQGRPAESWARELVTAVVEAGTFRRGGSAWRLLDGASLYHGTITDGEETSGNWSGTMSFDDPRVYEEIRRFRNPLLEGTGEALEELDAQFADLVAEADPTAKRAIEEVRWYEAAGSQPDPAQRLVLQVRAFERALPVSEALYWNEAVSHYLRAFWALDEFNNEVFQLARATDRILIYAGVDRPATMEDWLIPEARGDFTISLGTFLRQAKEIAPLVSKIHRIERRRVKTAGRWEKHPKQAGLRIEEWEQRFSHLLLRALRQRNATVHGTQTVPEVVATVDGFIARVAAIVVAQTVESTTGGATLMDALEKGRVESERTLWRLTQEDCPSSEILYRPEHQ